MGISMSKASSQRNEPLSPCGAGVLMRWLEQLGISKGGGEDGFHPNLNSKIEDELKQMEASRCGVRQVWCEAKACVI